MAKFSVCSLHALTWVASPSPVLAWAQPCTGVVRGALELQAQCDPPGAVPWADRLMDGWTDRWVQGNSGPAEIKAEHLGIPASHR